MPIVANQVQYSLLDRRPQTGMMDYAKEHGLRLAAFGTVAGGWLSDRFLGAPRPSAAEAKAHSVSMRMYRAHLDRWSRGDWALEDAERLGDAERFARLVVIVMCVACFKKRFLMH